MASGVHKEQTRLWCTMQLSLFGHVPLSSICLHMHVICAVLKLGSISTSSRIFRCFSFLQLFIYFIFFLCVSVLRDGNWQILKWTDVVVGDLLKITNGQFFPADLILLSSR